MLSEPLSRYPPLNTSAVCTFEHGHSKNMLSVGDHEPIAEKENRVTERHPLLG